MERIVVVGTSAGGIEALRVLLEGLPVHFPAPVCVVLHTSPQSPGILHEILNRHSKIPVLNPRNNDRLRSGRIYIAPPDCHLLVEPDRLRVTKGPKENRFRPAVDPLFRSAAQAFGPGAIGVVLTGNLDDGTSGLGTIKKLGGITVVQDPADALFPSMPESALRHVPIDYCVALQDIPELLDRLIAQPVPAETFPVAVPVEVAMEVRIAKEENPMAAGLEQIGKPSPFACPECHGVLLQLNDDTRARFRCHTGHAFSLDSLLAALSDKIEDGLWNAIRSLEEGALCLDALAGHVRGEHAAKVRAEQLVARADEARRHAAIVREIASAREPLAGEVPVASPVD